MSIKIFSRGTEIILLWQVSYSKVQYFVLILQKVSLAFLKIQQGQAQVGGKKSIFHLLCNEKCFSFCLKKSSTKQDGEVYSRKTMFFHKELQTAVRFLHLLQAEQLPISQSIFINLVHHFLNYPTNPLLILLFLIMFTSVLPWGAPDWVQYSTTINPPQVYLQTWVMKCYFTLIHPNGSINKNLDYPLLLGWVVTVSLSYFHKPFCNNCLDLTYLGMFIYRQGFDTQPVHPYYPGNLL